MHCYICSTDAWNPMEDRILCLGKKNQFLNLGSKKSLGAQPLEFKIIALKK